MCQNQHSDKERADSHPEGPMFWRDHRINSRSWNHLATSLGHLTEGGADKLKHLPSAMEQSLVLHLRLNVSGQLTELNK